MKCLLSALFLAAAALSGTAALAQSKFGDDLAFLKQNQQVVLLKDKTGSGQVVVLPALQGRVITSTADGEEGTSFGWVNRDLIGSHKKNEHINAYGGEDRFWLGPEGGQFGLFFKPGAKFEYADWQTPADFDTEPFKVVTQNDMSVVVRRPMHLTNYSGTTFDLVVAREIQIQDVSKAVKSLGITMPDELKGVAFATINSVTNTGKKAWTKPTGLLSIWILGMFNAGPKTTVVVPYQPGEESEKGVAVHDAYFGKVPDDRLHVAEGFAFFKADANYRSKIGIPSRRAKHVLGSFDPDTHTLTIVSFTLPGNTTDYVNSMWEVQKEPFGGDVANAYNDGPASPGAEQLGKFYELESSSPALALRPGQKATHTQTTIHLQGPDKYLDEVSAAVLGVSIERISRAFGP